jgi:hypothetical protein
MHNTKTPFKFLDAYQYSDKDVFFGRDEESEALYDTIIGVKHVLVYGPSGVGKTSLIQCGLRNQFSDVDWFAITIRRNNNMLSAFYAAINNHLSDPIATDLHTGLPTEEGIHFEQAVEQLFHERYQPLFLIFDQFEELLILGDAEEKAAFFKHLNALIHYKVPCRAILVLREEFLGYLSEFEHLCPSIFQVRFRLEQMSRSKVRAALVNILEAPRYTSSYELEDTEALSKHIIAKLKDQKKDIELTHLQVFLGELWDRALENTTDGALPKLHKGLLRESDKLESVLEDFLKGQLENLSADFGPKIPLEVLALMISERHTKLQLSLEEIRTELESRQLKHDVDIVALLKALEKRRIVRSVKMNDENRFEISHDLLASVVGQNLTEEIKMRKKAESVYQVYQEQTGLFSEEAIDAMRPFAAFRPYPESLKQRIAASIEAIQEEKNKEKKRLEAENKRQKRFNLLLSGLLVALAGVALLVNYSRSQAIQSAFNAQLQTADGLKYQGKYTDAVKLLHDMSETYSQQKRQATIAAKIDTSPYHHITTSPHHHIPISPHHHISPSPHIPISPSVVGSEVFNKNTDIKFYRFLSLNFRRSWLLFSVFQICLREPFSFQADQKATLLIPKVPVNSLRIKSSNDFFPLFLAVVE